MKKKSLINRIISSKKGFTLIELIVASSISVIIMGCAITFFILMFKSYDSSSNQAQAQNLSVLVSQKISDTLRYSSNVTVSGTTSGDGIYFDNVNNEVHIGNSSFMKGSFSKYHIDFEFSDKNKDSGKDNLLGIKITIKSRDQKTVYFIMNSELCLLNGKITSSGSGNAIQYS